ncbi:Uncharacterised protein [Bordetella pertussis]|nr:Uncharacterised protein [Bordetella pertussis]CFO12803.1 Uncharacterised protein [Bordetella pertussis]
MNTTMRTVTIRPNMTMMMLMGSSSHSSTV